MSDLSLLIHNQNEVQIDLNYLKQCQNQKDLTEKDKTGPQFNKSLTVKQIHLNKIKSRQALKNHSSLQKSITNLFASSSKSGPSHTTNSKSQKELLSKIKLRIDTLEQSHKRLERRMGTEMFIIKEELEKQFKEQHEQGEEVKRIRGNLEESKKKIGELLALIMVDGKCEY